MLGTSDILSGVFPGELSLVDGPPEELSLGEPLGEADGELSDGQSNGLSVGLSDGGSLDIPLVQ